MSESAAETSPYLSLRRAVQPAILAHCLLAADQERAGRLAAECEDLLFLTRELLKAAGRTRIENGDGVAVALQLQRGRGTNDSRSDDDDMHSVP